MSVLDNELLMLRNSRQLTDLIDNMKTQWNKGDMKRRRRSKMRKCRSRAPIHLAKLFNCCLTRFSVWAQTAHCASRCKKLLGLITIRSRFLQRFCVANFHSKRGSEKQGSSAHQPPPATKKIQSACQDGQGKSEQKMPERLPGSYCLEKKRENMKEGKSSTLDGRWRKANRS